ncbi:MAG: peptide-methionine (S)-S-oxide reductase MsrA [Bdellovibrionales bacterium]|nr:peptide-methionine (S)-S-oxide reductase MsrA [Bdellovibrionales bacterium]
MDHQKIIVAGGCFWGVEAAYRLVDGVVETKVGYIGGHTEKPSYEEICTGITGHVEAVEVKFDQNIVNLSFLLDLFFLIHDPTQLNRQGNDIGDQYRSELFYFNDNQRELIDQKIKILKAKSSLKGDIVTKVTPVEEFHEAESYHQKYLEKNPIGYCHINLNEVKEILSKIK